MAKKKVGGNNNNNNGGGGGNKEDGGKKELAMNVVVLMIDLHCEGCAAKTIKAVRHFDGVESVKVGDGGLTKLTVVGKVDPTKLRENVEKKTKKKVELISPVAKKDAKNNNNERKENYCEEEKKPPQQQQQKSNDNKKPTNQSDEKKSKELPLTTVVLKVDWHCQGCIQKIHRVVSKTKGFMEMSIDKQKDLITVKGAIDSKEMVEKLKKKLRRAVEIVPPKKKEGGDKEKGKGGGGGEGGKVVEGGQCKMIQGGGQVGEMECPYGYVYGSGYGVNHVHAPQLFSDENPNACAVM